MLMPLAWRRETRSTFPLRVLGVDEYPAAAALCEATGADGVLAGARITELAERRTIYGEVWGWGPFGNPRAVCWCGGNLIPVAVLAADIPELARFASARARGQVTSLVGNRDCVLALWRRLSPSWPAPAAVLEDQPLMELTAPSAWPVDRLVDAARPGDVEAVVPASVAMFTEELGFPPRSLAGYRQRVSDLVERGDTYVRWAPGPERKVWFKADLGATVGSLAQIHGVWVDPAVRGQGLATGGMAAVAAAGFARGFRAVSLYVNSFNAPAMAVYRKLGFRQVGTWATVLL